MGYYGKRLKKSFLVSSLDRFIRDPEDSDFSPVKEMVEKPLMDQLEKIIASFSIYLEIILFTVGTISWSINFFHYFGRLGCILLSQGYID